EDDTLPVRLLGEFRKLLADPVGVAPNQDGVESWVGKQILRDLKRLPFRMKKAVLECESRHGNPEAECGQVLDFATLKKQGADVAALRSSEPHEQVRHTRRCCCCQ